VLYRNTVNCDAAWNGLCFQQKRPHGKQFMTTAERG
jgi:hypothetical protein